MVALLTATPAKANGKCKCAPLLRSNKSRQPWQVLGVILQGNCSSHSPPLAVAKATQEAWPSTNTRSSEHCSHSRPEWWWETGLTVRTFNTASGDEAIPTTWYLGNSKKAFLLLVDKQVLLGAQQSGNLYPCLEITESTQHTKANSETRTLPFLT